MVRYTGNYRNIPVCKCGDSSVRHNGRGLNMLEGLLNKLRPQTERQALQAEAGINEAPARKLSKATYTTLDGEKVIVTILSTTKGQELALLAHKQDTTNKGAIWIAKRDQAGSPGTWLWTDKQMEMAEKSPTRARVRQRIMGDQADRPIEVAPIHKDRRAEILMIAAGIGIPDEEVIARLRAEGLDETLPENYRTAWNPYKEGATTGPLHTEAGATTEPLLDSIRKMKNHILPKRPQGS